MLQKQKIDYRIFIIEQAGQGEFNRAMLMNIGFTEASRIAPFDCFVFHDVDLIPEHDRNVYICDKFARHLSSAVDEMRYHVIYYNNLGGVTAFTTDNVRKVNGYSNLYWGWGQEDDDLSARTIAAGLELSRPPEYIGRYKMVRHTKASKSFNGNDLFLRWQSRWRTEGLNSLNNTGYNVLAVTEHTLYTNITVDLGSPPSYQQVQMMINADPTQSFFWYLRFYFP